MDAQVTGRRSLDFFMGLGFVGIGAYMIYEALAAYRAPLLSTVDRLVNPGSTTLVVGSLLVLLGLVIAALGFTGSGGKPLAVAAARLPPVLRSRSFLRGLLALGLLGIYFFGLWRIMPFWISTPIYLLANMFLFKGGKWWVLLIVAAATTGLVYYFFAVLAYIPLP